MEGAKLTSHIAILGAGSVGSAVAYALILNPIAGDILLVDPQEEMRDAQVKDLSDATFHGSTECRIRAGTHKEAGQCDVVVITAGAKQKKGNILSLFGVLLLDTDLYQENPAPISSAAIKRS